jgi:hypothetical protein
MSDEVTLTLPRDREFHPVAHLVLGGLASRLDVTVEALEDMQIGLAALLDRAEPGREVTVALVSREGFLEATVRPLELHGELDRPAGAALDLRRVLSTVVDDVAVEGDSVRLSKRLEADG